MDADGGDAEVQAGHQGKALLGGQVQASQVLH